MANITIPARETLDFAAMATQGYWQVKVAAAKIREDEESDKCAAHSRAIGRCVGSKAYGEAIAHRCEMQMALREMRPIPADELAAAVNAMECEYAYLSVYGLPI